MTRAVNEIWRVDFVADALFDGRKLRMLTVVDRCTRECLAIDVGQSFKGDDVVDSLLQRQGAAFPSRSDLACPQCEHEVGNARRSSCLPDADFWRDLDETKTDTLRTNSPLTRASGLE
jgi:hypothetical protein